MQALYDVPAPAKLNLFLHITGRRTDGYHLLQSAFMLIDWHDTLHFELRPAGKLSREDLGPPLPKPDRHNRQLRLYADAMKATVPACAPIRTPTTEASVARVTATRCQTASRPVLTRAPQHSTGPRPGIHTSSRLSPKPASPPTRIERDALGTGSGSVTG